MLIRPVILLRWLLLWRSQHGASHSGCFSSMQLCIPAGQTRRHQRGAAAARHHHLWQGLWSRCSHRSAFSTAVLSRLWNPAAPYVRPACTGCSRPGASCSCLHAFQTLQRSTCMHLPCISNTLSSLPGCLHMPCITSACCSLPELPAGALHS